MRVRLWTAGALAAGVLLFAGLPATAVADRAVLQEFGTGISPASYPWGITVGPDGNLWFTERVGNRIGRITPQGAVTEFSAGITAESYPSSIAAGPDGNLWFTEPGGNPPYGERVGRITPSGVVTEFSAGITAESMPASITAGPDGNLWFTEIRAGKIGRITPTGTVTEFAADVAWTMEGGIAAGSDGNLWFSATGERLGRITPAGVVTYFPTPGLGATAVTRGADGAIWFAPFTGASPPRTIGRMTTDGVMSTLGSGLTVAPFGIGAGPDGNLWFTDGYATVGRMTPSGAVTEFGVGPGVMPADVVAGPDGAVWYTAAAGNRVVRLTLAPDPEAPPDAPVAPPTAQQPPAPVAPPSAIARLRLVSDGGGYRVTSLRLTGLDPAARVRVRCVSGCRLGKNFRAGTRVRELRGFFRAPIARKATIVVRVTTPRTLGRYYRWTISPGAVVTTRCQITAANTLTRCASSRTAR